jgi:hypothetical protein
VPINKETNFAISIDEPPPKPNIPVGLKVFALSNAFISVFFDGSDSTSSKTSTLEDLESSLMMDLFNPIFIRSASVIKKYYLQAYQ